MTVKADGREKAGNLLHSTRLGTLTGTNVNGSAQRVWPMAVDSDRKKKQVQRKGNVIAGAAHPLDSACGVRLRSSVTSHRVQG